MKSSQRTDRSKTKYGDLIEDHEWEEQETEDQPQRTRIKSIDIDVMYDTEPDPADNYDRERYTVTVTHDRETGDPWVLYVVQHRWKGNYWRDITDWDWRDVPGPVRHRVANALAVDGPDDLDGGARLIDKGGESRWEKYHKHRVESMSGDEMWGKSFLKDALDSLESAAESFEEDSKGERLANKLVSLTRKTIKAIEKGDSSD